MSDATLNIVNVNSGAKIKKKEIVYLCSKVLDEIVDQVQLK